MKVSDQLLKFVKLNSNIKNINVDQIDKTLCLIKSGILDSLKMILFISYIEATFKINFEMDDLLNKKLTSLLDIEAFVLEKIKSKKD